jgi:hypothetical protein
VVAKERAVVEDEVDVVVRRAAGGLRGNARLPVMPK